MVELKRKISLSLDHDQIDELVEEAVEEFGFLEYDGRVCYHQNRECLEYIDEESSRELWEFDDTLNHVVPPELREEFDGLSSPEC